MSTMRRPLKSLGMYRDKAQSDMLDVAVLLQDFDFEECFP